MLFALFLRHWHGWNQDECTKSKEPGCSSHFTRNYVGKMYWDQFFGLLKATYQQGLLIKVHDDDDDLRDIAQKARVLL